jgi:hypothetical protein
MKKYILISFFAFFGIVANASSKNVGVNTKPNKSINTKSKTKNLKKQNLIEWHTYCFVCGCVTTLGSISSATMWELNDILCGPFQDCGCGD